MRRSPLRVLTWNILKWSRPAREDALIDVMAQVDADVLLLQECDAHTAERLAGRLGLSALAVGAGDPAADDPRHSDPCILTRLAHRNVRRVALEADRPDQQPDALAAEVELPGGRWLEVRSLHLSHTPEAGRLGFDREYLLWDWEAPNWTGVRADSVRRRLTQVPAAFGGDVSLGVAGGDINCPPFGPEFRAIAQLGWADAWSAAPRLGSGTTIVEASPYTAVEAAGYRRDGSTWWPAASGPWDYTLDAQFHRGLAPLWAWTVGRGPRQDWALDGSCRANPAHDEWTNPAWPSDHLGVVVDYEFPWELGSR